MNTIRYGRLRAGLTQTELARRVGISQPALARIEAGRVQPRMDTMARLLRECGLVLDVVPLAGTGVDRSTIRRMLRLSPKRRLQVAAEEANHLAELKPRRLK